MQIEFLTQNGCKQMVLVPSKVLPDEKKVRTSYYHPKQGKELFSPPFDSSKYEKNQIVI